MYNHHASATPEWYSMLNDSPGRVGPPIDPPPADLRTYWHTWLERDGHPFWPFWAHLRGWWQIRALPNVRLVHFESLKRDLPGQIRCIASFLEIPIREARFADIVLHCSFDWMKQHAAQAAPMGGAFWDGGAQTFIHKGVNGRWRDTLGARECADYEKRAEAELGAACAKWLATGVD
jgi:aryl sulfotransferase